MDRFQSAPALPLEVEERVELDENVLLDEATERAEAELGLRHVIFRRSSFETIPSSRYKLDEAWGTII
ncbi:hypothetical protein RvY_03721 [Ramazzottius varieornatus]|uniref:Uncharacterized protein n=1 Tax=Ramazzottius varieornatus TaxID=947166 RepID=A0A1D1UPW0_RAMVA|nr:hypothetical protein RvY_03721 [Ramazzottius varieornatus]